MTNIERRKRRRQRRIHERLKKNKNLLAAANDANWIFSYSHVIFAYKHCRNGVKWKPSVQRYSAEHGSRITKSIAQVISGTFRSKGFYCFYICERGKPRYVQAVKIEERVVQCTLCYYCLIPVFSKSFVYDNSASQKGKGYHFAIRRLRYHLTKYMHKYGVEGWALIFDFKSFFDTISHEKCKEMLSKKITDPIVQKLCFELIDSFNGDIGLGLGSHISQILALCFLNPFDHFIKEVLKIEHYGRYNDDGYLIFHEKQYLEYCYERIVAFAESYGLKINHRKTHIIKLTHGFTYLKKRIKITPSRRIVMKICKSSIKYERNRLKKLHKKVLIGALTERDVRMSFQSWESYALYGNAYRTIQSMRRYYFNLYGVDPMMSLALKTQ